MDVSQLKAAQDSVVAALRWAEEDQWTEQTPCPDWDVRALVDHLITGNERFVVRLAGEQPGPPPDRSGATTRDLVEAYEQTNVEVLEAFGRPGVMQDVSQWPIGPLSGRDALGLKIAETLVHGWDLQQALGTTIAFDEATIAEAYAWSEPMLGRIPEGRNPFGTPQDCPPDAPPVDRLAALLGRAQPTVS
jgi:uncharacterized protein (TIGR03086 family)